ncbi:hypothetical protein ACT691_12230 [Vibrio metschnikovii]
MIRGEVQVSDEQAVTSFEGLIRDLTNPESVERLKQRGVLMSSILKN